MDAQERLVDSLAQRLYSAFCEWEYDLGGNVAHPKWWALRPEFKVPFNEAAEAMISGAFK